MGSTNEPGNHALIFGASGITGWAITNALLSDYPSPDAFSKVTALTNRPLSKEQAQWPESSKLRLVSGIDLLMDGGQQGLEKEMQSKIGDMSTVSHVYFFSYVMDLDPAKEISINVTLLERAVTAVENLSKNLKYVVLPTGTKAYGVHLIDKFPFTPPLAESLPRIPEPYASEMFYYNQLDMLASLAKGKQWTWCEVRPDVVVGFVPNNNVYCLAQALALYLSCYAAVAGPGASVEFPGTAASWTILSNDSSQDILAKFSIWASLHPSETGGQAFNVADNARPSSWSEKWPVICEFFGLQGVGPPPNGGSGPQPGEYLVEHVEVWRELEQKHGLQKGRVEGNERSFGGFPYFIMTMFNFDRQMDMSKLHETWGDEKVETDAKGAWWTAFERFRRAKIIP